MQSKTITLNNKFYSKEHIEKALKDFKEVMQGQIINNNYDITLTPLEDIPNLEWEFYNYVLALMKNS